MAEPVKFIRVQDKCCSVCFLPTSKSTQNVLVVHSSWQAPRPLDDFVLSSFSEFIAYLVHSECYKFVNQNKKIENAAGRLCVIAETLTFLWRPSEARLLSRARQIGQACLESALQHISGQSTPQDLLFTALAALTPEVREIVFDFTFPCAFTQTCTVLGVAEALSHLPAVSGLDVRLFEDSIHSLKKPIAVRPSFGSLLGHRFVAGIKLQMQPEASSNDEKYQAIVETFDDMNCVDVSVANDPHKVQRSRRSLWYRRTRADVTLTARRKGLAVQIGTPPRLCLWDEPNYKEPFESCSYDLPVTRSGQPVLMRSLRVDRSVDGITVINQDRQTCALLLHRGDPVQERRDYRRIEEQWKNKNIVWQYLPIPPEYYMANLAVRRAIEGPAFMHLPCLAVELAHESTSDRRMFTFGFHVGGDSPLELTYQVLGGPFDDSEVTCIYTNQESPSDGHLRLGALVRQTSTCTPNGRHIVQRWKDPRRPSIPEPVNFPVQFMHWGYLNVQDYSGFRSCVISKSGEEHCIGLMFYPGREVLGQWREDLATEAITPLPTPLMLGNFEGDGYQYVRVQSAESLGSLGVKIEGSLEWWFSHKTSRVGASQDVESQDPLT